MAALVLLACMGCSQGPDAQATQEQDILSAVQIYLRQQGSVNPDAMGMELTNLALEGSRAVATVRFTSPDGSSNLEVQYQLEKGEGGWTVSGSASGDGHGGQRRDLPPDHPPLPEDPPADAPSEPDAETS